MPEPEKFVRRMSISWDGMDSQSRQLARKIAPNGPWNCIVAIARGGLVPATTMAYELNIRMLETVCISTYDGQVQREAEVLKRLSGDGSGMLVVDDVVDTGVTARMIREMLPKAYIACIYAKPLGLPYVDASMMQVEQDTWIDFPWETPVSAYL